MGEVSWGGEHDLTKIMNSSQPSRKIYCRPCNVYEILDCQKLLIDYISHFFRASLFSSIYIYTRNYKISKQNEKMYLSDVFIKIISLIPFN